MSASSSSASVLRRLPVLPVQGLVKSPEEVPRRGHTLHPVLGKVDETWRPVSVGLPRGVVPRTVFRSYVDLLCPHVRGPRRVGSRDLVSFSHPMECPDGWWLSASVGL